MILAERQQNRYFVVDSLFEPRFFIEMKQKEPLPLTVSTREFRIADFGEALSIWKTAEGVEVAEGDSERGVKEYLLHNPGLSRVAVRRRDDRWRGTLWSRRPSRPDLPSGGRTCSPRKRDRSAAASRVHQRFARRRHHEGAHSGFGGECERPLILASDPLGRRSRSNPDGPGYLKSENSECNFGHWTR